MENFSERIMTNRLDRGFFRYQKEFEDKALEVLRSGWYVLGKEVSSFEEEFASYIGAKYCVGLASGLDALILAFRALKIGEGDEVIVQGNTYIASVMGITMNGATPVFCEPDEHFGMDPERIEGLITEKTKAVLVTHLYGMASRMDEIVGICQRHHLKLVEDCAQSHGACFGGQMTGTFGDVGCFSFYPSKNLGAFDQLDGGQGENTLFGYGDGEGAHFDATLAEILSELESEYAADYAEDLARTDAVGNTVETRLNMYTPLYYLLESSEGWQSSSVAKYWRIRSGITQGDCALSTEMNLALALESCGDVESVDFETVWGAGHTQAERTGNSTENFIAWVNECMADIAA